MRVDTGILFVKYAYMVFLHGRLLQCGFLILLAAPFATNAVGVSGVNVQANVTSECTLSVKEPSAVIDGNSDVSQEEGQDVQVVCTNGGSDMVAEGSNTGKDAKNQAEED
jgi:hypothetical protein